MFSKLKIDNRIIIFLVVLALFAAWLAALVFVILPKIMDPEAEKGLDLVMGLGVGGVTQFFLTILALAWQFYFRKRETDTPPTTTPPTVPPGQ
jgi:hypothetical protein